MGCCVVCNNSNADITLLDLVNRFILLLAIGFFLKSLSWEAVNTLLKLKLKWGYIPCDFCL